MRFDAGMRINRKKPAGAEFLGTLAIGGNDAKHQNRGDISNRLSEESYKSCRKQNKTKRSGSRKFIETEIQLSSKVIPYHVESSRTYPQNYPKKERMN